MRDLIVIGIFAVGLIYSLRNPFYGVLTYYWVSIMAPHRYTWGFAYHEPLAMIAALFTFISTMFHLRELRFPKTRETFLFLLFWLFLTVTSTFALYSESAWAAWKDVSKIFLMIFLTIMVIQTKKQLQYFLLAVIGFVGFLSVKGALFGILTAGKYRIWGPPESNLADNNFVGVAMVMIIPLCFFLARTFEKKWQAHGLLVIGYASLISAVLTYSRGAVVGLAVLAIAYLIQTRHKILVFLMILTIIGIGYRLLPSNWFERMDTIETYQEDASANQRIDSWWFCYNLARARLLGGGFECFTPELYYLYAPNPEINIKQKEDGTLEAHTAHSIYFEVLAEHGFIGLAIYLVCLLSILLSMRKLDKISRKLPNAGWISDYSRAFIVSIIGFMACAAFVSRAYFELFWVIYAAAISFKSIVFSGNWKERDENMTIHREQDMEHDIIYTS